jgi:hypothetical protein
MGDLLFHQAADQLSCLYRQPYQVEAAPLLSSAITRALVVRFDETGCPSGMDRSPDIPFPQELFESGQVAAQLLPATTNTWPGISSLSSWG